MPGRSRTAFGRMDDAGRLDIVVNNAGVDSVGRVERPLGGRLGRVPDTNLKGPFLVARQAIPRMRSTGGGVIVNVASNAGLVARPTSPPTRRRRRGC